MLKLDHVPISFNSRRVWIVLLEKGLKFELVELKLDGDQFQPDFVALNPFHHIPVLVDDGFRVSEVSSPSNVTYRGSELSNCEDGRNGNY